ncbi:MAG: hypothetical protein VXX59_04995 [Candidatus Thermoplasmatota archaeon]|nr:hypothetical protein [Candidatus Thermoplasmatota archaeon]
MSWLSELKVKKILTDGDLDGVLCGAILLRAFPDADIKFGHPGALKDGMLDYWIDSSTAICDLPHHPSCGLSIDHHLSNKPSENERRANRIWRSLPSAARVAANLFKDRLDLSDLESALYWTDKLDSGDITRNEYLSDEPMVWIGRCLGVSEGVALRVLGLFSEGYSIDDIVDDVLVSDAISTRKTENEILAREIENRIEIIDRMAIVRMNDLGMRSNGYAITAFAGDDCDACMIIHGSLDGSFDNGLDYPVSASFYTNSFLHRKGGLFDLTKLAKRFDVDGGGHRDACGCRIKPLENGLPVERQIEQHDIEHNIREWLKIWNARIGDDDDVLM